MSPKPATWSGRAGRLAKDLLDAERRPDAVRRVRRRAAALVAGTSVEVTRPPLPQRAPRQGTRHVPRSVDGNYVGAWANLTRAVTGSTVKADRFKIDGAAARAATRQAFLQSAQARLAVELGRGASLERAVVITVHELARHRRWSEGWALAEGVRGVPGGHTAAVLGLGLLRHRQRQFVRSWVLLAELDDALLAGQVPIEAVDGALATNTDESRRRARLVAEAALAGPASVLTDLAGRFLAYGEVERAARLVAEVDARPAAEIASLDDRHARSLMLTRGWTERHPKPVPGDAVTVAVIDYQSPDQDLTSGNLGDYVQTLAMLGHVVRHRGARFSGENGLGELAAELQQRVRPDLRIDDTPSRRVHLLDVNREFTSGDDIPDGTWMIAFGWHMHPMYDLRYDFPYNPALRPIFVSFHLNRLAMISDDALEYLRAYGPVGCRDWSTVFLLLSAGVDAFFSGCLTTTVDALFPTRDQVFQAPGEVGLVDVPPGAAGKVQLPVRAVTHQADEIRLMSLTEGLREADRALADYQAHFRKAVTSRLHAYLPLVALGVPVEFRMRRTGDVRFNGLLDLEAGSERLAAIQNWMRDALADVLGAVLGGADESQVYDRWRELTEGPVARAKTAFAAPNTLDDNATTMTMDLDSAVASCRSGMLRSGAPQHDDGGGEVTNVVLCFDHNIAEQAAVLIESVLANASGPIQLTVLGRGLHHEYADWFSKAFPQLPVTIFRCDEIDYGSIRRLPARITVSTMDRLLAPLLLADVERCVYLDVDTLVLGDLTELGGIDLGGAPFAARPSDIPEQDEWRSAALGLPADDALDLQRSMGNDHRWGGAALNAGVLVMDLARMRRDRFSARALRWIDRYGFHDQDVLLAYQGRDRCVLDPRWNALPVQADLDHPAIIHWAELAKPWDDMLTPYADVWRDFAASLFSRVPRAPGVGASAT